MYHLHLQGKKSAEQETSVQQVTRQDPEDGGHIFIRNVGLEKAKTNSVALIRNPGFLDLLH
jgi:hypothetical protein